MPTSKDRKEALLDLWLKAPPGQRQQLILEWVRLMERVEEEEENNVPPKPRSQAL